MTRSPTSGGTDKLSTGVSTNVVEGTGFSAVAEGVYGMALIKIPIFEHKLKLGIKGNFGGVGVSGRVGLKNEIVVSSGVGGGFVFEWE